MAPENSDAQVAPAGRRGAHPPSRLVPGLLPSCPLISGNVGGLCGQGWTGAPGVHP